MKKSTDNQRKICFKLFSRVDGLAIGYPWPSAAQECHARQFSACASTGGGIKAMDVVQKLFETCCTVALAHLV